MKQKYSKLFIFYCVAHDPVPNDPQPGTGPELGDPPFTTLSLNDVQFTVQVN